MTSRPEQAPGYLRSSARFRTTPVPTHAQPHRPIPSPAPLDVATNRRRAAVMTYRVEERAPGPEGTTPQVLLQLRQTARQLTPGEAFDGLCRTRRTQPRDPLEQEVNLLTLRSNLHKRYLTAVLIVYRCFCNSPYAVRVWYASWQSVLGRGAGQRL